MESALEVQVENSIKPVVKIRGEVNFTNAGRIREIVHQLVDQGHFQIWLDISAVDFIDSSGISALIDCMKMVKPVDGAIHLKEPSAQLVHLLIVTGFAPYFDLGQNRPVLEEKYSKSAISSLWQATRFSVPCRMELVASIRDRVAEIARSLPFTSQELGDVKIAVGEAASNAFRHGCRGLEDAMVEVSCVADSQQLVVEITDPGGGFDCNSLRPPVLEEIRDGGMGVHFMRLLMDEVKFKIDPQGCTVRLTKNALPDKHQPDSVVTEPVYQKVS